MPKTQRMSGKELQKAIIDLAHLHGWCCAHFASVLATRKDGSASWRTPVQADGRGWPDIFMVRRGEAMAVEVKGDGDTLKDEQTEWLRRLETAGIPSFVWTPKAWRDGTVEHVLKYGPPL